ncbi:hypothetical protein F5884DRAFT_765044 [Xylogone sp. PMI_703]|nr:hypothetical protein F5884DRAFT_765044 [Xylogone sp. PMI_703]
MQAVEKRHHQLSQVFCRYINYGLSLRCGDVTCCTIDIQVSPLADLVYEMICESLTNEVFPSLGDILQALDAESSNWANFYRFIPEKETPKDFRSLSYLFYVYQVMRTAFEQNKVVNSMNRYHKLPRLLISVDDAFERLIYSRSQKLLKKLRASSPQQSSLPNLLEVYLCRRVFISRNQTGSNLYLDDPSPEFPRLKSCESIDDDKKRYRSNGGGLSDGLTLNPFDIVKELYGADTAEMLEDLFLEVGLSY